MTQNNIVNTNDTDEIQKIKDVPIVIQEPLVPEINDIVEHKDVEEDDSTTHKDSRKLLAKSKISGLSPNTIESPSMRENERSNTSIQDNNTSDLVPNNNVSGILNDLGIDISQIFEKTDKKYPSGSLAKVVKKNLNDDAEKVVQRFNISKKESNVKLFITIDPNDSKRSGRPIITLDDPAGKFFRYGSNTLLSNGLSLRDVHEPDKLRDRWNKMLAKTSNKSMQIPYLYRCDVLELMQYMTKGVPSHTDFIVLSGLFTTYKVKLRYETYEKSHFWDSTFRIPHVDFVLNPNEGLFNLWDVHTPLRWTSPFAHIRDRHTVPLYKTHKFDYRRVHLLNLQDENVMNDILERLQKDKTLCRNTLHSMEEYYRRKPYYDVLPKGIFTQVEGPKAACLAYFLMTRWMREKQWRRGYTHNVSYYTKLIQKFNHLRIYAKTVNQNLAQLNIMWMHRLEVILTKSKDHAKQFLLNVNADFYYLLHTANQLRIQMVNLRNAYTQNKEKLIKLESDKDKLSQVIKGHQQHQHELEILVEKLQKDQDQLNKIPNFKFAPKQDHSNLKKTVEMLTQRNALLQQRYDVLTKQFAKVSAERKQLHSDLDKVQQQLQLVEDEKDQVVHDFDKTKQQYAQLLSQNNHQVKVHQNEIIKMQNNYQSLEIQKLDMDMHIKRQAEHIKHLEHQNDKLKIAQMEHDDIVQSITQQLDYQQEQSRMIEAENQEYVKQIKQLQKDLYQVKYDYDQLHYKYQSQSSSSVSQKQVSVGKSQRESNLEEAIRQVSALNTNLQYKYDKMVVESKQLDTEHQQLRKDYLLLKKTYYNTQVFDYTWKQVSSWDRTQLLKVLSQYNTKFGDFEGQIENLKFHLKGAHKLVEEVYLHLCIYMFKHIHDNPTAPWLPNFVTLQQFQNLVQKDVSYNTAFAYFNSQIPKSWQPLAEYSLQDYVSCRDPWGANLEKYGLTQFSLCNKVNYFNVQHHRRQWNHRVEQTLLGYYDSDVSDDIINRLMDRADSNRGETDQDNDFSESAEPDVGVPDVPEQSTVPGNQSVRNEDDEKQVIEPFQIDVSVIQSDDNVVDTRFKNEMRGTFPNVKPIKPNSNKISSDSRLRSLVNTNPKVISSQSDKVSGDPKSKLKHKKKKQLNIPKEESSNDDESSDNSSSLSIEEDKYQTPSKPEDQTMIRVVDKDRDDRKSEPDPDMPTGQWPRHGIIYDDFLVPYDSFDAPLHDFGFSADQCHILGGYTTPKPYTLFQKFQNKYDLAITSDAFYFFAHEGVLEFHPTNDPRAHFIPNAPRLFEPSAFPIQHSSELTGNYPLYQVARNEENRIMRSLDPDVRQHPFGIGIQYYDRALFWLVGRMSKFNFKQLHIKDWVPQIIKYFKGPKLTEWCDENTHCWANENDAAQKWHKFVRQFLYYIPKGAPKLMSEWILYQKMTGRNPIEYLKRFQHHYRLYQIAYTMIYQRYQSHFIQYKHPTISDILKALLINIGDRKLIQYCDRHKRKIARIKSVKSLVAYFTKYWNRLSSKVLIAHDDDQLKFSDIIFLDKHMKKNRSTDIYAPRDRYKYGTNFVFPCLPSKARWYLPLKEFRQLRRLIYPYGNPKLPISNNNNRSLDFRVNLKHRDKNFKGYKPLNQSHSFRNNRNHYGKYRYVDDSQASYYGDSRQNATGYDKYAKDNDYYWQPNNYKSNNKSFHQRKNNNYNDNQRGPRRMAPPKKEVSNYKVDKKQYMPRSKGHQDNRTLHKCPKCGESHPGACRQNMPRYDCLDVEICPPPPFTNSKDFSDKCCSRCGSPEHLLPGCYQKPPIAPYIPKDKLFTQDFIRRDTADSLYVNSIDVGCSVAPYRDINGIEISTDDVTEPTLNPEKEEESSDLFFTNLTTKTVDDMTHDLEERTEENLTFVHWFSKVLYYCQTLFSYISVMPCIFPLFALFLSLLSVWCVGFSANLSLYNVISLVVFMCSYVFINKRYCVYKFLLNIILIFSCTLPPNTAPKFVNDYIPLAYESFSVRTIDTLSYVDWNKVTNAPTDVIKISNAGIDAPFKLDSGSNINLVNRQLWTQLVKHKRFGHNRYIIHTANGQNFIKDYLYLQLESRSGERFYTRFYYAPGLNSSNPFILSNSVCRLLGYTLTSVPSFPVNSTFHEDVTVSANEFEKYDPLNTLQYDPTWIGKDLDEITYDLIKNETMFVRPEIQPYVRETLKKFWQICGTDNRYNIGCIKGFKWKFHLKENAVFAPLPIYSLGYEATQSVREQCKQLLIADMISEVTHPVGTAYPTFVLWKKLPAHKLPQNYKKEGRMLHNFALLNDNIIPIQEITPNLWESVQKLGGKTYVSSYDLRNAYSHIELDESVRKYVRFSTPDGKIYEWKRACFGLRDLPSIWNQLMFHIYSGNFIPYFDDISHSNNTFDEWKVDFHEFCKRTFQHNLTLRISKCVFCEESVQILGHMIHNGDIIPTERQRMLTLNIPVPTTKAQLKRYLGSLSYNSKFIMNFGHLTEPFYALLRSKVNFPKAWSSELEKQWIHLTKSLQKYTVLSAPDWDLPFCLAVDASDYAAGAAIFQIKDHTFHFIELGYKVFSHAQKNGWHSTEKEVWAVAHFLDKYDRYFISGIHRHHVFSDAEILRKLFSKDQVTSKLMRYRYRIGNYKVMIHHLPGDFNTLADMLSRDLDVLQLSKDAKPLEKTQEQWGHAYYLINKGYQIDIDTNVTSFSLPSYTRLKGHYEAHTNQPLCPQCHHDLEFTSIYNLTGILTTSCHDCGDILSAKHNHWLCPNSGFHEGPHAYCRKCITSKSTMDDIHWKLHNINSHDPIHKRHLCKPITDTLQVQMEVSSHFIQVVPPKQIEVYAVDTHPIPNILPINDSDLPTSIKCPECSNSAYPYYVKNVWPHQSACDQCNKDLFPDHITYHCRDSSHKVDDENNDQYVDTCLECVFKQLNKPVPSKFINPLIPPLPQPEVIAVKSPTPPDAPEVAQSPSLAPTQVMPNVTPELSPNATPPPPVDLNLPPIDYQIQPPQSHHIPTLPHPNPLVPTLPRIKTPEPTVPTAPLPDQDDSKKAELITAGDIDLNESGDDNNDDMSAPEEPDNDIFLNQSASERSFDDSIRSTPSPAPTNLTASDDDDDEAKLEAEDWHKALLDENFYLSNSYDIPAKPPWDTTSTHFDKLNVDVFRTYQHDCVIFGPIIKFLNGEIRRTALNKHQKRMMSLGSFKLSSNTNLLTWKSKKTRFVRICVPEHLQSQVVHIYHDKYIHTGIENLRYKLRRRYYWPGMYNDIAVYLSHCTICQNVKEYGQPHPIQFRTIAPQAPNEVLGMDYIGPLNVGPRDETYILTIVDYYDNYVQYIPCTDNSGYTTFKALLDNWILKEGVPQRIVVDRGSHFTSALQAVNSKIWNFKLQFTTAYNPRSSGLVERFNRTIRGHFRTIFNTQNFELHNFPWWDYCSFISYVCNMTINKKTGFPSWHMRRKTPVIDLPHLLSNIEHAIFHKEIKHRNFYSFLRHQKKLLQEVKVISKENWKKYLKKKAARYWSKLTQRQIKQLQKKTLQIGTKVMVKDVSKSGIVPNKLLTRKHGPYTVIARAVGNNAYKLRHDETGKTDYVGLRRIRPIHVPTDLSN